MPFRIVYLDDEPEIGEMFKENLRDANVEVDIYSDPERAIQEIVKNPPQLIFIDYRLRKTNGDKVANQLKVSTPIALITGDIDIKPSYPFKKIFHKPINFSVLDDFIQSEIGAFQK